MAQGAPTNLDLLRRTTRADFYSQIGVAEAEALYPQICMEVDSDSDRETYAFFGAITKPVRTDITSGATLSGVSRDTPFKDYSMSLKNATWVWLQSVERDIIEDAKLDQIRVRAQSAADAGVAFQDERFTAVLEANGLAYEGTAFFGGTHHGVTSAAKDNDTTSAAGTGVIPNVTEFEDGFALSVASLRGLTDDQNRIANTGNLGLVCMVDPTNERVARAVLEVGPMAGQTGNSGVFKGRATVVVNPYMTSTAGERMFLFVTSKPIRPVVYQTRIPWDFKLITDGDDWEKKDLGAMKGRARFDYLLGDWKKANRHIWS
jgi:phage major head subunit gpT-like protein